MLLVACTTEGGADAANEAETARWDGDGLSMPAATTVRYTVMTELSGAQPPADDAPEGTRWQVVRDDGVTIYLASLHVGLDTLALVPCATNEVVGELRWSERLRRGLEVLGAALDPRPAAAWAAHPSSTDSTALDVRLAEPLVDVASRHVGEAPASGATYCQLHVLHSPLGVDALDGFALGGRSMALRGWLRRAPDAALEALEGDVLIRGGALLDLQPASAGDMDDMPRPDNAGSANDEAADDAVTVTLQRRPAQALATVDVLDRDPIDIAFDVLIALGETASARVTLP